MSKAIFVIKIFNFHQCFNFPLYLVETTSKIYMYDYIVFIIIPVFTQRVPDLGHL